MEKHEGNQLLEVDELLPLQVGVGIALSDGHKVVMLHVVVAGKRYGLPLEPAQARTLAGCLVGMADAFEAEASGLPQPKMAQQAEGAAKAMLN
jgi:hypothetical protein